MLTVPVFMVLAGVQAQGAELRLGRAAVVITPPAGVPMAGYYYVRLSDGVHDDLHAKALVLQSGGVRTALVALDLISCPRPMVEEARRQIAARTGIPGSHVMISGTHAHTGPEMGGRLKGVEPQIEAKLRTYLDSLPSRIAEAVGRASADLRPVRALSAAGYEDSLSFIRRFRMKDGSTGWNPGKLNPNIVAPLGLIDPRVPIVYFEDEKRSPLAAYVNFANHLDTVGGLKFSADYPYMLGKVLGEAKGPGFLTLFTIGCAGNINHIDTRRAEPQKGDAEAARIGAILAAAVLKALPQAEEINAVRIQAASESVALPPAPFSEADVGKARETLANYGKPGVRPFYEQVAAFKILELAERGGKPYEAEVQAIALGRDVAWVGLPGEIFVELGRAIQFRSPFKHTIVVALANGNLGYVPDRRAYPQGAYEVISTRLAEGGGEALVESAVRLLLRLHKEAQ